MHPGIEKLTYNGNVSQYGWISESGEVKECSYNGCHSQILSYPWPPKAAWSFGPNIPEMRLRYIFDMTVSPWRSLVPTFGTSIAEIQAGAPFVYDDLSLDANLLVNHMFSIRWPAEQINSYALWSRLVLSRVHPGVADVLTSLVATRDQTGKPYDPDKLRYTTTQLMHSNFVALDLSMEYAENFVNGKMAGGNGNPFKKTQTVGCANDYTQSNKSRGYKPVVGAFGPYACTSFMDQLKGVRGPYMAHLEATYGELRDFSHLVQIGLDEQKRFNLDDWSESERYASRGVLETPGGVELGPEAINALEESRRDRSDWSYIQESTVDPNYAHPF